MNIGRHPSGALILMLLTTLASQVAADERVQEFTYDDAGRLQKVVSPEREVTYTLDDAGNRTSLASEQREIKSGTDLFSLPDRRRWLRGMTTSPSR